MSSQKIRTCSDSAETIATILGRDKYQLNYLDGTHDCAIDLDALVKKNALSGRLKKPSADKDVFLLDNGDGINGRGDVLLYTDNGEFRFAKLFENRDETKIPKEISDELKKLEAAAKAAEEATAKAAETAAAKAAEEEAARKKEAEEEAARAAEEAAARKTAEEAAAKAAAEEAARKKAAEKETAAREEAAEATPSLVESPEPASPAGAPTLEEPPPGQVQGSVIDAATKAPIQGAVVSFPDYSELNALLTSPAGGFLSYEFPLGELKVLVTHPSYEPVEKTVTIEAGEKTPLEFALTAIPETPSSVEITKEGKIELKNKIHFESGKINLHPDSAQLLDPVATLLKEHPEILKVEIGGHTDDNGNDKKNLKLSQKRADAVRDYLVRRGIDKTRLESKGYGENQLIKNDSGKIDREKSRRIEFKIIEPAPK